ncbi:MAG: hypothetical protein LLG02_06770 [Pelosinus sp.]|nr:hypothetical protein [Pelosinus sp.]
MTNEDFQKLLLEELANIKTRLTSIDGRVGNIESQQKNADVRLTNIESQLKATDVRLANVESQFKITDVRLTNIESQLKTTDVRLSNVESQLTETNGIVKALMHRTEELDAKLDGLAMNTASKEALTRIEANMATKRDLFNVADDVSFLVRKAAEHDLAIRKLRMAE